MATNLSLDDNLIEEAKRIGHHKTKRDAVNIALSEYIQRHKRLQIFNYVGKIEMSETKIDR
jgi:Arc/MetJ family transcription regulator